MKNYQINGRKVNIPIFLKTLDVPYTCLWGHSQVCHNLTKSSWVEFQVFTETIGSFWEDLFSNSIWWSDFVVRFWTWFVGSWLTLVGLIVGGMFYKILYNGPFPGVWHLLMSHILMFFKVHTSVFYCKWNNNEQRLQQWVKLDHLLIQIMIKVYCCLG